MMTAWENASRFGAKLAGSLGALALSTALCGPVLAADDSSASADLPTPQMSDVAETAPMDRDRLREEIRAYLLENPEVLVEAMQVLEQRRIAREEEQAVALVAELGDDIFNDGYSWVGGNPDGSITVVEFLDYRCGFCKRAHPAVSELVESDGDIRLIVKEFPILGPDSTLSSRFAMATLISQGPDAYKDLSDTMMSHGGPLNQGALPGIAQKAGIDFAATQAALDDPKIDDQIAANMALAEKLDISGTPTFVIGDKIVRGFLPLEEMREVVAQGRSAAN